MAASSVVQVKDGLGSFVSTNGGVDVTPGNTITIRLQSTSEVSQWALQIFGVDEITVTPPSLTGVNPTTHIVTTPATEVTFTMPSGVGVGRALIFRSSVNGGGSALTTTFGVYVRTSGGYRIGAVGERLEGDPSFGWASVVNKIIRDFGTAPSVLPPLANLQYATLMEDPAGDMTFQLIQDTFIQGGHQTVADVTARDAIPSNLRRAGMVVWTQAETTLWILGAGLTNGDWTVAQFGGGSIAYDVILDPNNPTSGNSYQTVSDLVTGTSSLTGFVRVLLMDHINTDGANDLTKFQFVNFSTNESNTRTITVVSGTSIVLPHGLHNVGLSLAAGSSVTVGANTRCILTGNGGIYKEDGVVPTGSLQAIAGNLIGDGENFILDDGVNPAVTFEFDKNGSVVETSTLRAVTITNSDTSTQVRDAMEAAINNATSIGVNAFASGPDAIDLLGEWFTNNNVAITDTVTDVGFTHTGFTGGVVDPDSIDLGGMGFNLEVFDQAYFGLSTQSSNPLFTNGSLGVAVHPGAGFNYNAADAHKQPIVSSSVSVYASAAPFGNPVGLFDDASSFQLQRQTSLLTRPPMITSDQAVYGPPGWEYSTYIALTSDASRQVNGLTGSQNVGPQNGFGLFERVKVLFNAGSFDIVFNTNNAVDPYNDIDIYGFPTSYTLVPGAAALVVYDTASTNEDTLNKWRMYPLASSSGGAGDVQIDVSQTINSGSPVTIHTYTDPSLEARGTICYELLVSLIGPSGGNYASFKMVATFERDGSTITERDVTFMNGPVRSNVAYDVTFNIVGLDINLQVTGVANGNGGLRWRAIGSIARVDATFAEA